MDVVVEVGGWEHECCGSAIERNQVVDLSCIRRTGPDGQVRLVESHHHIDPEERVQGRVADIQVVQAGEAPRRSFAYRAGKPSGASTMTTTDTSRTSGPVTWFRGEAGNSS